MSQGEPDFKTPSAVCEAGIRAILYGPTKYTAVAGIRPLREAIRGSYDRDHGLDYSIDQITVGCGAKQVVFNALFASVDPGDEVVISDTVLDLLSRYGGARRRQAGSRRLR
ncbi:aminotransferase class I/II-fold pyridoxal phosphate-dependent enzyme [Bradyrhizobium sp. WSM3983]|uniref:aminotransferase class I/II-fold pyridoxal phosphate-dependent enzyme n=1 Tax=Bradyrhizobium sp. WSM3983 TaxID=1038867 RepID=UPI0004028F10